MVQGRIVGETVVRFVEGGLKGTAGGTVAGEAERTVAGEVERTAEGELERTVGGIGEGIAGEGVVRTAED